MEGVVTSTSLGGPFLKPKFKRPELLTHPPIPMPLHGVNPRSVLGKKWWDETRYMAYEQNNRFCWACNRNPQRLEAHECYAINFEKGTAVFTEVVALCSLCHHFVHSNRLRIMVDSGIYSYEIFDAVRNHGYNVLIDAGLEPSTWAKRNFDPDYELPDELLASPMAPWSSWRMIIYDKTVGPKFSTVEEHRAFYARKNMEALERQ